ncbi:MAG TPA: tetratricopeptide repeat protein [Methylomirabilota bacterium]|nr:tetratricopeptide repeat protein [Methylomirabilota bacterium]
MPHLLLVAALLLAACQQPPARQVPAPSAVSPAEQMLAEGGALMAQGNYVTAVERLRQAADLEPGSVPVRFALGTAYSFLGKRPEAIAQFRWVMSNAPAESTERDDARRWLVRVGALVESPPAPGKSDVVSSDATAKTIDPAVQGSISGQTQWTGVTPAEHQLPVTIAIVGSEDATRELRQRTQIRLGERFEFKDVREGQYRLIGAFADKILWDQSVTVKGGKQTDVALSQATSLVPVNTFPPPAH